MTCARCLTNQHTACYEWDDEEDTCCDNGTTYTDFYTKGAVEDEDSDRKSRGRESREASLKDPQSTGRKRAVKLYPIDPLAPCEWQGLLRAGGGKHPIVGCLPSENRLQTHVHHGPDKNTLNNDQGNVHRICAFCHNRWHAKNDPTYNPNDIHEPHDASTPAGAEDQLLVEYEEAKTANMKVKD